MQDVAQRHGAGWWTDFLRRRRMIVVAWSVMIAVIAVFQFVGASPPDVMSSRVSGVASSIDVLDHGGPPLVASDVPYHPGIDSKHLSPAGTSDDEGIYLYLPLLGHWSGERTPAVLMLWFSAGCFGLLILLLPSIVFALFDSLVAAILAPLLILWKFNLTNTDLYWVQAWVMLLGIPGLVLAHRWWIAGLKRRTMLLLAGLMLAAGFATSIRAHAGLPIFVAAVGVVLLAGGGREILRREAVRRVGLVAALTIVYFSIAIGFVAVRAYRDSQVHVTPSPAGTAHPFWHPAYLGLGYLPNRYGIAWSDSVAIDAVERAHPGAPYLGPTYEATLRHLYVKLVEHDPSFALRTYVAKARVIAAEALRRFWLLPLLLAAALALRRRPSFKAVFLLALPSLVVGAASPLLAVPLAGTYELGWLGATGALWLLAISWAVSRLPAAARALNRIPELVRLPSRTTLALVTAFIAAAIFAVTGSSAPPSSSSLYKDHASTLADPSVPGQRAYAQWAFSGALPRDWRASDGVQLQRDDSDLPTRALYVLTTTRPRAVEVTGPVVSLQPGSYQLAVQTRILVGGMRLIVRDVDTNAILVEANASSLQSDYVDRPLGIHLSVDRPSRIRISLQNWTAVHNSSAWIVERLTLQQLKSAPALAARTYYAPHATPLVTAGSLPATALQSWPFMSGLPQGWAVDGNPLQATTPRGLDVRTTPGKSAYQLVSQPFQLQAGRYDVAVSGRVLSGGIEVGVLDNVKNQWIITQHFWSGQGFGASQRMTASFKLSVKRSIRLVLSNWSPRDHSSEWLLDQIDLLKLP